MATATAAAWRVVSDGLGEVGFVGVCPGVRTRLVAGVAADAAAFVAEDMACFFGVGFWVGIVLGVVAGVVRDLCWADWVPTAGLSRLPEGIPVADCESGFG